MTENKKNSIKNLIYFFLGLIAAIGLSATFAIFLSIQLWSKEFWICCAAGAAIYFTGYRTANLTKPFTISAYLQRLKAPECDLVAMEATEWGIIKRARQTAEEKKRQAELMGKLTEIRKTIERNEEKT